MSYHNNNILHGAGPLLIERGRKPCLKGNRGFFLRWRVSEIAKSRIECLFNRVEQLTYDLAPQLENFPKKERTLLTLNIRTTLFELLAKLVSSEYVVSRRVAYLQQCHSKVRT